MPSWWRRANINRKLEYASWNSLLRSRGYLSFRWRARSPFTLPQIGALSSADFLVHALVHSALASVHKRLFINEFYLHLNILYREVSRR
jgi:hypothetical protein